MFTLRFSDFCPTCLLLFPLFCSLGAPNFHLVVVTVDGGGRWKKSKVLVELSPGFGWVFMSTSVYLNLIPSVFCTPHFLNESLFFQTHFISMEELLFPLPPDHFPASVITFKMKGTAKKPAVHFQLAVIRTSLRLIYKAGALQIRRLILIRFGISSLPSHPGWGVGRGSESGVDSTRNSQCFSAKVLCDFLISAQPVCFSRQMHF
ncbi:hypothetical protein CEXT_159971 [Caerostris extrusa]|uniref:Secreted protein n=1 Tax=Caerostris extrusa TaxID=172846 RepID=A0AAV4TPC4_CAEEX|nr:hypothetical protein CEXT_159971 [Caerostris extrusa]